MSVKWNSTEWTFLLAMLLWPWPLAYLPWKAKSPMVHKVTEQEQSSLPSDRLALCKKIGLPDNVTFRRGTSGKKTWHSWAKMNIGIRGLHSHSMHKVLLDIKTNEHYLAGICIQCKFSNAHYVNLQTFPVPTNCWLAHGTPKVLLRIFIC